MSLAASNHAAPSAGASLPARLAPGVLLSLGVSAAALGLQAAESLLFGKAWLEAIVLAIVIGAAVRTLRRPSERTAAGVAFSSKVPLEIAVALMGASISAGAVVQAGGALLAVTAAIVFLAIAISYGLGRAFGLPHRMATLIACGNSICGNSAIAAAAPVIGAHPDDVAASIAFTAVLGVITVIALPILAALLHLSPHAFGILAGLTVYAVPQVLAATASAGPWAIQIGALVKLMRVLMLGPVVLALSLTSGRGAIARDLPAARPPLVPAFILGFLALAVMRSLGAIPAVALAPAGAAATGLTILSMAALGLGVDVRSLAQAGTRTALVVTLSLLALVALALAFLQLSRQA